MNQIYVDSGLVWCLNRIAGESVTKCHWRLWTNNFVPDRSTVIGNLTLQAGAWADKELDAADFTVAGVLAHVGVIQAPTLNFVNGSGGSLNIYGYAIVDPGQTKLIAVARLDAAPVVLPNAGTLSIVPIHGDLSFFTDP